MAVRNPASRGHKHKAASLLADTLTAQDILYVNASGNLALLPIGTEGQNLTIASGIVSWETGAASGISNVVEDTTPQLGGNLDLNGKTINGTGVISMTGAITANSLSLTTSLDETDGGTGQSTITAGDILYGSASNVLSKLAKGTDGEVLTLASGVPSWAAAGGGGGGTTAHKTADEVVTSNNAVQNDDHIAFTGLTADTWYKVEGFLPVSSYITPDFRAQWVFTQAPSDTGGIELLGNDNGGAYTVDAALFNGQLNLPWGGNNAQYHLVMTGTFKTNATTGGDLQFKWAQGTSSVSATTVHAGAWVTITPM